MTERHEAALKAVREGLAQESDAQRAMQITVEQLAKHLPDYTWTGIYVLEGNELCLGPYVGKPSPHTRIPLGRGICGAAAAEKAGKPVEITDASGKVVERPVAFVNFDFTPGDRVLFAEDLTRDVVGNFPQRLEFDGVVPHPHLDFGRRWSSLRAVAFGDAEAAVFSGEIPAGSFTDSDTGPGPEGSAEFSAEPYSMEGLESATAYAIAEALGFAPDQVDWIPNAVFEQAFALDHVEPGECLEKRDHALALSCLQEMVHRPQPACGL